MLSNTCSIFPISPVSGVGRSIGWLVGFLASCLMHMCIFGVLNRFTCNWTQTTYQTTHQHSSQYHQNVNVHNDLLSMNANDLPWFYYYYYCCCLFLNAILLFHWTVFLRIKKGLLCTELLQYIQWQLKFFPKKTDSQFRVNQFQAYRNRGNHMHFRYVCDSNAGKWKSWNKKPTTNKRNPFTHTHIFRDINTHMRGCIWIAGGSINGVGSAKIDRSQTG